eukprot:COSAG05_NODE_299_length_11928_cov_3.933469_6_plen_185_part_00
MCVCVCVCRLIRFVALRGQTVSMRCRSSRKSLSRGGFPQFSKQAKIAPNEGFVKAAARRSPSGGGPSTCRGRDPRTPRAPGAQRRAARGSVRPGTLGCPPTATSRLSTWRTWRTSTTRSHTQEKPSHKTMREQTGWLNRRVAPGSAVHRGVSRRAIMHFRRRILPRSCTLYLGNWRQKVPPPAQ